MPLSSPITSYSRSTLLSCTKKCQQQITRAYGKSMRRSVDVKRGNAEFSNERKFSRRQRDEFIENRRERTSSDRYEKKSTPVAPQEEVPPKVTREPEPQVPSEPLAKVALTTYSTKSTQHTQALAEHLSIPVISPDASPIPANFLLVVSDRERMMLQNVGLGREYYVDFYQIHHQFCAAVSGTVIRSRDREHVPEEPRLGPDGQRLSLLQSEHLRKPRYKVLRHIFPSSHPKYMDAQNGNFDDIHMLDITGGMGVNAYIYAHAGMKVTLVEKDPILYALLYEGYELAKSLPGLREVMKRITLVHADPLEYMKMHLPKEDPTNKSSADDVWNSIVNAGKEQVGDAEQNDEDSTTITTSTKSLKKKRRALKKRTFTLRNGVVQTEFPWDFVLMEPRYYDGMAAQQGYYQKNLEEVLKPYIEQEMDWLAYAHKVQDIYETATGDANVPVLIKYPILTTKFLENDKWILQRHEAQYIDRVYKRFADQEYEYQVYVSKGDARQFASHEEHVIQKQKNYLELKFKEHQRKANKLGGKEALREHEREQERKRRKRRFEMIEVIDEHTPFARDELSALDIEGLKEKTHAARRDRRRDSDGQKRERHVEEEV